MFEDVRTPVAVGVDANPDDSRVDLERAHLLAPQRVDDDRAPPLELGRGARWKLLRRPGIEPNISSTSLL